MRPDNSSFIVLGSVSRPEMSDNTDITWLDKMLKNPFFLTIMMSFSGKVSKFTFLVMSPSAYPAPKVEEPSSGSSHLQSLCTEGSLGSDIRNEFDRRDYLA